jgi:hypothetical protein
VIAVEPQGAGWAFAFFAAQGQQLGHAEVDALTDITTTVAANTALLRSAVRPGDAPTAVYSAGGHAPALASKENPK